MYYRQYKVSEERTHKPTRSRLFQPTIFDITNAMLSWTAYFFPVTVLAITQALSEFKAESYYLSITKSSS